MDPISHIFISHQQQCNPAEVEKLINYLQEAGFNVQHGNFSQEEFNRLLPEIESYVCVLDEQSHRSKNLALEITAAAMNGKKVFAIFCPALTVEIQLPAALDTCAAGITEWNPEKLEEGLKGEDIGFTDQQGKSKANIRGTKPPSCK